MNAKTKKAEQGVQLEPSPYDLGRPTEAAPVRRRHDPRIPEQRLTAFWVVLNGVRVGRVKMVEFEEVGGWWYQAEVVVEGKRRPVKLGEPHPRRKLAVDAILAEAKPARARRQSRKAS